MKPCGIITLLSDFGLQDPYAAEMKGVILSINPKASLVDLGHLVPAQKISVGSFRLWRAYRHFPKGTIHLAVVDPGVGTSRKLILAVSTTYFFLAPDNGLLSPILEETPMRCYDLNPPRWREAKGFTFHGRDLLAPAAALLSLGKPPQRLGRPFKRVTRHPSWIITKNRGTVDGKIIDIDRFGNLITNIAVSQLSAERRVHIFYQKVHLSTVERTYGLRKRSRPIAVIGSAGLLEIALPQGNAQKALKGAVGQKITVRYD